MSANTEQSNALEGAYLTQGTVGMPGAPIMHFYLVVVPSANSVSGTVEITQAIAPSDGSIVIRNVTGTIRAVGFGTTTHVVALDGIYYESATPPQIGTWQVLFSAHLAIDNDWNGTGGFSYGNHNVENVPVKNSKKRL